MEVTDIIVSKMTRLGTRSPDMFTNILRIAMVWIIM